jgi:predicted acyltransferase
MSKPLPVAPDRLISLDAYRGFIMLVMASDGFGFAKIASEHFKDSAIWQFLAYQFEHVQWTGCAFWDLIQPSFMFMVGVAIPYSHASRLAKGQSQFQIAAHVLVRSVILVLLGIFLSSNGRSQTNFTFVNVLTQIGLGYAFVYLLRGRGVIVQLLAAAGILVGYWYVFYGHQTEIALGATAEHDWRFDGLFAHWNKNANFASDFDHRFLALFPLSDSYPYNGGGYQTLNFIPSMATMVFGLMAGELLRSGRRPSIKLIYLATAGVLCVVIGWKLGQIACPIVKRIWTPSWAVFSAGWTFLLLGGFYLVIDIVRLRWWTFPLVIVGMNSIAMYVMSQLLKPWTRQTLRTHIVGPVNKSFETDLFGGVYGPLIVSVSVLFVFWLICLAMYRKKIFIRI